jgi:hypothetical protein
MTSRMKTIAMSATLIVTSGTLFAAGDTGHRCAQVRDNVERLACYDQAFGKPAEAAPAIAPVPEQHFGFKEKEVARKDPQPAVSAAPDSVAAAIKSVDRRRDGKFVVTLDNDQVWAQSEFNSQADVEIGDPVTVRRGVLGSYLLVTRAGIGTRVKRVK